MITPAVCGSRSEEWCVVESGTGTYSFDIASCRIRAIYVVRNPHKLRGFLQHTH